MKIAHTFFTLSVGFSILFLSFLTVLIAAERSTIVMDGRFDDWKNIKGYTDPANDPIDTDGDKRNYKGTRLKHVDVDVLEYKVAHDADNLYIYVKSQGVIGRTKKGPEKGDKKERAGRYYITVAIDVDQNNRTGYWLHEGGTYPTSGGYDMNVEIEWYNGEFNTGMYMNKCCEDKEELKQNFLSLSRGKYEEGNDGPYPAGYHTIKKGKYEFYPEWVYHEDGTLTFVVDRGPIVHGILTGNLSDDGHELEMKVPYIGFLKNQHGEPIAAPGKIFDIGISLQASGELAGDGEWAGDGTLPIEGYKLD
ncbi:hypothetical protein Pla110_18910 [Polystyrenella longa]|uniref:Carbohydrate-binding domain-containing protein n=1 Tax=Polystyrenella longa TaxID=2528007 RepID=A0A518CLS9_9PLAN|nr:hypothetical protein [Polystyrenella longa]QDU80167.1 hypothetical protein Pla110_18910 [Polystyrenella longa]